MRASQSRRMRSSHRRLAIAATVLALGVLYPNLALADGLGRGGYLAITWLLLIAVVVVLLFGIGLVALVVWAIRQRRGHR